VSYAFEKIFEEGRGATPALGSWAVSHLQKSLDNFESLLKARGLAIDSYDSIKYLYDQIEYPLAELTKFVHREPSEIASRQAVAVFAEALQSYFGQLRHIAGEIDEEYGAAPAPVVQPPAKDISIVFTTVHKPQE
jgi:hypothetical protein